MKSLKVITKVIEKPSTAHSMTREGREESQMRQRKVRSPADQWQI